MSASIKLFIAHRNHPDIKLKEDELHCIGREVFTRLVTFDHAKEALTLALISSFEFKEEQGYMFIEVPDESHFNYFRGLIGKSAHDRVIQAKSYRELPGLSIFKKINYPMYNITYEKDEFFKELKPHLQGLHADKWVFLGQKAVKNDKFVINVPPEDYSQIFTNESAHWIHIEDYSLKSRSTYYATLQPRNYRTRN